MTGWGYEILVDARTRTLVLAKFMDGKLLSTNTGADASASSSRSGPCLYENEETLILQKAS